MYINGRPCNNIAISRDRDRWNRRRSLRAALNALPAVLQDNNGTFAFLVLGEPRPRSARTEPRTRARPVKTTIRNCRFYKYHQMRYLVRGVEMPVERD